MVFANTSRPEASRSSRCTIKIFSGGRFRLPASLSRAYRVRVLSLSVAIVSRPGGFSTTMTASSCNTTRIRSPNMDGQHRDRTAIDALHGKSDRIRGFLNSNHVEKRQVVIGSGHGQQCIASERFVINQWLMVSCIQRIANVFLEGQGPV